MAATLLSKPVTLAEFSELTRDGQNHEVVGGELITMPPAKSLHSRIAHLVFKLIGRFLVEEAELETFLEVGYVLSLSPLTVRQPDISVLRKDRVWATPPDSYFEGAPEIAIEIVSPSDGAEYLEGKVRDYLAAGAREVWVLYPKTKHVHIFCRTGEWRVLSETQIVESPELLPGFSVKVSEFFPQ